MRVILGFLAVVAALLLLSGLDGYALWNDEAHAALIGRNIARTGLPRTFDGVHHLLYLPADETPDRVFRVWGWLPLYVNALTCARADAGALAARLPHALVGLLFLVWLLVAAARVGPADASRCRLHALLCVACVPLLLHFRQCGYSALSVVFAWMLFVACAAGHVRPIHRIGLLVGSVGLFNCHYLLWGCAMGGCAAVLACRRMPWQSWLALAVAAMANLPMLLVYRPWELAAAYSGALGEVRLPLWKEVAGLLHLLLDPVAPLPLLVLLLLVSMPVLRGRRPTCTGPVPALVFTGAYIVVLGLAAPFYTYQRYVLPVVPVILSGVAWLCVALWQSKRALVRSVVVVAVLGLVTGTAWLPGVGWTVQMAGLLREIRTDPSDVNEALISFFHCEARSGQTVLVNYGSFPLIFHTDLVVAGGTPALSRVPGRDPIGLLPPLTEPDWVVIRTDWDHGADVLHRVVATGPYARIDLPAVDTPWGNRPCSGFHRFATPTQGPVLSVYRRVPPVP